MLSEGGLRVPFVVHWPGTIPGGRTDDRPVISLDVAATTLAIAGIEQDAQLDGVNLMPYLNGENAAAPHDALYWRWIAQSAVLPPKPSARMREALWSTVTVFVLQRSAFRGPPVVCSRCRGADTLRFI